MTKLDSDAIFDAPARRMLNQCRQACSNPASASGLHGYDRPASMRAMIGAASMSSGRPAAVDVAMTAIPLETGWRRATSGSWPTERRKATAAGDLCHSHLAAAFTLPRDRPRSPHRLSALAHQKIACPEQHASRLLLLRLHRHETHGRPRCRLADRLGVGRVVLLPLDVGAACKTLNRFGAAQEHRS